MRSSYASSDKYQLSAPARVRLLAMGKRKEPAGEEAFGFGPAIVLRCASLPHPVELETFETDGMVFVKVSHTCAWLSHFVAGVDRKKRPFGKTTCLDMVRAAYREVALGQVLRQDAAVAGLGLDDLVPPAAPGQGGTRAQGGGGRRAVRAESTHFGVVRKIKVPILPGDGPGGPVTWTMNVYLGVMGKGDTFEPLYLELLQQNLDWLRAYLREELRTQPSDASVTTPARKSAWWCRANSAWRVVYVDAAGTFHEKNFPVARLPPETFAERSSSAQAEAEEFYRDNNVEKAKSLLRRA